MPHTGTRRGGVWLAPSSPHFPCFALFVRPLSFFSLAVLLPRFFVLVSLSALPGLCTLRLRRSFLASTSAVESKLTGFGDVPLGQWHTAPAATAAQPAMCGKYSRIQFLFPSLWFSASLAVPPPYRIYPLPCPILSSLIASHLLHALLPRLGERWSQQAVHPIFPPLTPHRPFVLWAFCPPYRPCYLTGRLPSGSSDLVPIFDRSLSPPAACG